MDEHNTSAVQLVEETTSIQWESLHLTGYAIVYARAWFRAYPNRKHHGWMTGVLTTLGTREV